MDRNNNRAAFELKEFEMNHPRAIKLLRKRKKFLVVAEDEPYYMAVYQMIREHEQHHGRWTAVDEASYQAARDDRREGLSADYGR